MHRDWEETRPQNPQNYTTGWRQFLLNLAAQVVFIDTTPITDSVAITFFFFPRPTSLMT